MQIIAGIVLCLGILGFVFWLANNARSERRLRVQERHLREEFEAYARLDATLAPGESPRDLARRACATVVKHSSLKQSALLLRDAELRLQVVGSAGMENFLLLALDAWGERFAREQRQAQIANQPGQSGIHAAAKSEARRKSYPVTLGPLEAFDPAGRPAALGFRSVTVLPLWSQAGAMLGALIACPGKHPSTAAEASLTSLEALASTLARSVENATLSERLLRAEKMAGLGQLAKGVAHELNNPLTAVIGFAELVAETASEPRIREDAQKIVTQALRMKGTVEGLLQFWRPVTQSDVAVDLAGILRKLEARALPELKRRGVKLVMQLDEGGTCCTRGHEERLLEVFEHLLNNAAQAVAAKPGQEGTRAIRVTLAREAKTLQVVVSDTGSGFAEPARVFDPFYTTRQPGEGQGMGLAMSYGIVREHGGEISAFNLTPHGAAVVVELPVARVVRESGERPIAIAA